MIQRSYPEDEFEVDYYHIESSETETELNPRDKIVVSLSHEKIEIGWSNDHIEIGLNLTENEHNELREAFENSFKERTILLE